MTDQAQSLEQIDECLQSATVLLAEARGIRMEAAALAVRTEELLAQYRELTAQAEALHEAAARLLAELRAVVDQGEGEPVKR